MASEIVTPAPDNLLMVGTSVAFGQQIAEVLKADFPSVDFVLIEKGLTATITGNPSIPEDILEKLRTILPDVLYFRHALLIVGASKRRLCWNNPARIDPPGGEELCGLPWEYPPERSP